MYPDAYIAFLGHFHGDRDYFECHERLEEYWKSLAKEKRSSLWVGLIQIAVALYHQRRGNFPGATKMMDSAIRILSKEQPALEAFGLDPQRLLIQLAERLHGIRQQLPYESMQLPLADPALINACQKWCKEHGMSFGRPSDLTDEALIHRHILRDRSEVIREREESLRQRAERMERQQPKSI